MIACDKSSQNGGDLPEEINPSDVVEGKDDSENATVTSSLKFSFPEGASSVFKSLFTDEFDISAVEYCVIYTNVDTKTTTEGKRGNLSVGMIEKITDSTVKNDDGTLKNFVDDFCTKDEKGVVTSSNGKRGITRFGSRQKASKALLRFTFKTNSIPLQQLDFPSTQRITTAELQIFNSTPYR